MTQDVMTIKIGDGTEVDIATYNMELISSPEAFSGNIKSSNIVKVDFPEEDGDVIYIANSPKMESFEYKIKLAHKKNGNNSLAQGIITFMTAVLGKKLTIKNKYKGVQLVGYPMKYSDVEYLKDEMVAIFDLTIYVPSGTVTAL